ncbi:MAG TPA: phosphotransferase [Cellvibrionaceae bacterium]
MQISHSIVSESYLRELVEKRYSLGDTVECTYLLQGLNDSYLIQSNGYKYIFRIYRYGRRTLDAINSEIQYVSYLDSKSSLVAGLISNKHGEVLIAFDCPEGKRYGFLMQCAANTEVESHCILTGASHAYGQSIAKIHKHSAGFNPQHSVNEIDVNRLIWKPISLIEKYFPDVDISHIYAVAKNVSEKLSNLDLQKLTKSYIHGDVTGGNACLSNNNEYIFFDFDCFGYGWLAYDLSIFYWSVLLCQKDEQLWRDFIDGYRSINELCILDLSAIPLLVMARHFWIIGYSIEQMSIKGKLSYKINRLEQDIQFLKMLEDKQNW